MWDYKLIVNTEIPKGSETTPWAMMPRILCLLNSKGAYVYVNRICIRKFIHHQNGIKKMHKLTEREQERVLKIYGKLIKKGPILIKSNAL